MSRFSIIQSIVPCLLGGGGTAWWLATEGEGEAAAARAWRPARPANQRDFPVRPFPKPLCVLTGDGLPWFLDASVVLD